MSLRPVGPLVEACGKACLQLWIDEHTPEMDAWGVWYEGAVKAGEGSDYEDVAVMAGLP